MDYKILQITFIILAILWTIYWKIYSSWNAARHNHKVWFIILVLFNTLGILDIIYIFLILKKSGKKVKKDFLRVFTFLRK